MPTQTRLDKIANLQAKRDMELAIVLEDIHDPHNASAILRTCDAFGIQNVYYIFEQEKSYNPAKIGKSSSSSANKWLTFHIFKSTQECLTQLKNDGYTTFATTLEKDSQNFYDTDFTKEKTAFIFGNEHRGISETASQLADTKIYIPMRGMVQSLNVSVTASICIYEATRQRQK
jgi:tRNA (guanosine-2'-O-)-methyltransferase